MARVANHTMPVATGWSPALWPLIDLDPPPGLDPASRTLYQKERLAIEDFVAGLPAVRRLFAHLPTAMIFDDHDITDDWNLSREWEEIAYGHPFSKRVIGNALFGYLLNQAWGNHPDAFDDALLDQVQAGLQGTGGKAHDELIERLLRCDHWHYSWPTTPPRVVVDSRTHRWRSESAARKPEGIPRGRRLLNGSGIGLVEVDVQGVPWRIHELLTDGRDVTFSRREAESRWN